MMGKPFLSGILKKYLEKVMESSRRESNAAIVDA